MELGTFSVSLAVTDLDRSLAFYETLGFEVIDGGHRSAEFPDGEHCKWRIIRNGATTLGLFQGMFEHNTLTFNPPDVRAVQRTLREHGIALDEEADEDGPGPAHAFLMDPDGNPILLDQHQE